MNDEKIIRLSALQKEDGRITITDKRAGKPWAISDDVIGREYDRLLGRSTRFISAEASEFAKNLKAPAQKRMCSLDTFSLTYIAPQIIKRLQEANPKPSEPLKHDPWSD